MLHFVLEEKLVLFVSGAVPAAGNPGQEALDAQAPAQMVRVGINGDGSLYPEISGHKSRFSIRFMESGSRGRPSQSAENIPFRLTCCVF